MNEETKNRLKKLKIEDLVWYILIGIIILSLYNNQVERKFIIFNDYQSKEKYRFLQIFIFSVALIIYLYYAYDGYKDLKSLNIYDSKQKIIGTKLAYLSGILVAIATAILLYVAIFDTNVETEIFFN